MITLAYIFMAVIMSPFWCYVSTVHIFLPSWKFSLQIISWYGCDK